jgi:hypothetical protein
MSIGLPATTTCRMMGHAWVTQIQYDSETPTHVEVCARCGAVNEPRERSTAYVPRHLRPHGDPATSDVE